MLTVIVTIKGRSICRANSICDNMGRYICSVNVIASLTRRYICSSSSYCDNNDNKGEVYM